MKATIKTTELKGYLKVEKPFVANKSIPVLECVNIKVSGTDGKTTAKVTNLEQHLEYSFDSFGESLSGEISLPFKDLQDYINTLSDDTVTIEAKFDGLADINRFKLMGLTLDDEGNSLLPLLPDFDKPESLLFSSLLFHELDTASKYASKDELRPQMMGVYIGTYDKVLTVACTDAHSLYKGEIATIDKEFSLLVPAKAAAQHVSKIAAQLGSASNDVLIEWNENNVVFSQDRWRLYSRLIDARFPNINAVIPTENPVKVTFNKAAMLKAIDKVKIAANKTSKVMNVNIADGQIELECIDIDENKELRTAIPCHIEGDGIEIAYNHAFLSDLLKSIISPEVTLQMSTATRAAVIQEFHRTYLIMPVMRTKAEA